MKTKEQPLQLSDELKAFYAGVRPLTKANMRSLKRAGDKLNRDPAFQADVTKSLFVAQVLQEMEALKISQNKLAKKWGKSRQYVGKVINEDKRVNFTIQSMTEIAMLFGKRLQIKIA